MQLKSLLSPQTNLVTVVSTYRNVLTVRSYVPNKRGVCPHLLDVIKFLSGFQVEARQSPITHTVANKRSFGHCPVLRRGVLFVES